MSDLLVIENLIQRWHGNGIFSQIPLRSLINKLKKIETPGIRSLQYWQKNLQLAGNMLLPCDLMSYTMAGMTKTKSPSNLSKIVLSSLKLWLRP